MAELRSPKALAINRAGRCRDVFAPGAGEWGRGEGGGCSQVEGRGSRIEDRGQGRARNTEMILDDGME